MSNRLRKLIPPPVGLGGSMELVNGSNPNPEQPSNIRPIVTPIITIGFDADGQLQFHSLADPPNTLFLIEQAKMNILHSTKAVRTGSHPESKIIPVAPGTRVVDPKPGR